MKLVSRAAAPAELNSASLVVGFTHDDVVGHRHLRQRADVLQLDLDRLTRLRGDLGDAVLHVVAAGDLDRAGGASRPAWRRPAWPAAGACAASVVIATGRLRASSATRQNRFMSLILEVKSGAASGIRARTAHGSDSPQIVIVAILSRAGTVKPQAASRSSGIAVGRAADDPSTRPSTRARAGIQRIRGHAEHRPTIDHRAPRLRHRRHAELHPARHRRAVPRRLRAAVVLFPDPHPGKVGASAIHSRTPAGARGEYATKNASRPRPGPSDGRCRRSTSRRRVARGDRRGRPPRRGARASRTWRRRRDSRRRRTRPSNTCDRVAEARNSVTPRSRNGGPSVTCCGPANRPVGRRRGSRPSRGRARVVRERDPAARPGAAPAAARPA